MCTRSALAWEMRTRQWFVKSDKREPCNTEVNQNQFLLDWPGVQNELLKPQGSLTIPERRFLDSWLHSA